MKMKRSLGVLALLTSTLLLSCGGGGTSPDDDNGAPADVDGGWQGIWYSPGTFEGGPFVLEAEQTGSTIGGSITIPDIDMTQAPITGTVDGRTITFGDIDQRIQFTGTVDTGDTSASGTYQYQAMGDNGTWSATKGGAVVALVDSFALPEGQAMDVTWDGTTVWVLMNDQVWSLDPGTGQSASHPTPGQYPEGITYDGAHLLVGDSQWGTGKIYLLLPGTTTIMPTPSSDQIRGLAFDGSHFWCADGNYAVHRLFKVTTNGAVVDSVECAGTILGGLTFDGTTLWYVSWDAGQTSIYKCDVTGQTLASFPAPGSSSSMSSGLAFGNGHLWYSDGVTATIYELDTAGQVVSSFTAPSQFMADLAFDGAHLWVAAGDVGPDPDRLYEIDTAGTVLSQFECPGSSPGGLTYDGQYLWLVDMVTDRIYRLPTTGDYFLPYPDFEFGYLTTDGADLWGTEEQAQMIRRFNSAGATVTSLPYPCEDLGGIAHDGAHLWVAEGEWMALAALHMLDAAGAITATYRPLVQVPEPCGIAWAGSDLWMIGRLRFSMDYKLYRLRIQSLRPPDRPWSPATS